MSEMQQQMLRRKHCSVDLQQVVIKLDIYKRPLFTQGGKSSALLGVDHEAAVATTENGKLYLIEKGVTPNDDINYPIRYREGECRIVEISPKDIRDWGKIRSVRRVDPGITLEDLFDSCGGDYNFALDNCWNGTHRMRAKANPEEDGMAWQGKALLAGAAIGLGVGLLAAAFSGRSDEKKKIKQ